jgi:NDP-sugar pyrophosphorylase family protein
VMADGRPDEAAAADEKVKSHQPGKDVADADTLTYGSAPDVEACPAADVLTGDRVAILAGGEGTRLSDSGDLSLAAAPKLLLEIFPDGPDSRPIPMIDYVLRELYANGFANIAVVTAPSSRYGDAVSGHVMALPNNASLPTVIRERARRGTGWATRVALSFLYASDLIVLPGDIVFPFGVLQQALFEHCAACRTLTWLVTTKATPTAQNFGRIVIDTNIRKVVCALEGPTVANAPNAQAGTVAATSAGVIIMSRNRVIDLLDRYIMTHGQPQEFELYSEFMPWVIETEVPVGYFDVDHEVHDLGAPERIAIFRRKLQN